MNACQSLPAVFIVLATVASPLNEMSAQDTTPVEEAPSSVQAFPVEEVGSDETAEAAKSNPFVPATAPQVETVTREQVRPAQPITSDDIIQSPVIITEEIVMPITEEVLIPTAPPTVISVPIAPPEIFFDSPAPSQSDRRISKEKVAELRQQRALYRANQRMARMEYNLWMGREPLRPRWSPMPMMNSRYSPPTIVVPVFINPR
jgi:hypothetical protein